MFTECFASQPVYASLRRDERQDGRQGDWWVGWRQVRTAQWLGRPADCAHPISQAAAQKLQQLAQSGPALRAPANSVERSRHCTQAGPRCTACRHAARRLEKDAPRLLRNCNDDKVQDDRELRSKTQPTTVDSTSCFGRFAKTRERASASGRFCFLGLQSSGSLWSPLAGRAPQGWWGAEGVSGGPTSGHFLRR